MRKEWKLGLVILKTERESQNPYKYLQGVSIRRCQTFGVPRDRTRSTSHKLKHKELPLNMRNNFFPWG